MPSITHDELIRMRTGLESRRAARRGSPRVVIGMGTCGLAAGAGGVRDALLAEAKRRGIEVEVGQTGCIGMCEHEVLVEVIGPDGRRFLYGDVTPDSVPRIVEGHLVNGEPVDEMLVGTGDAGDEPYRSVDFFSKQHRVVLKNCGLIDPESIEDYIAVDGYEGLARAVTAMEPAEVISWVKRSGLRGRGGAGFPTGLKWEFTSRASGSKKYVVCNGDEGDPGAFMDRSVMEGDPHAVVEGMLIAAYAIGADEGYIYVRAEYPLAIKRLRKAISQAEEMGLVGDRIFGTDFGFRLHIKEGAGAFVCGEETALLASIEGRRGMPRPRPPFPAQSGLWGCPTNINNVETYANVPWILRHGPEAYSATGTEGSKGTKVFALAGKVSNTGLAEVPMGLTLREVIFDIGGGIRDGKEFKAVQIGGPSGGCLPKEALDVPVDYDSLTGAGAIMGSGGMIVMDEETCMVDLARFFLNFTQQESCGKCTPCREGTMRMLEILTRITEGEGRPGDVEKLETLAAVVKDTALCGLGQTAPNPVLTTLRYFRDEYEAHVSGRSCPALSCPAFVRYRVIPDLCKGCTLCLKACPSGAVTGDRREPHVIDETLCIGCGACMDACPFGAIIKVRREHW